MENQVLQKQNIMKTNRVLLTFLLVVMALCAHAGDNNSALRKSIAMANAMCPVSLGAMGEMTSMVYEKGDLIISYALNEDVISVETLKNNKEMVRQNATTMVRNATGDLKTTFDLLASEGAGLVMKYIGKQSKAKFTIRFTAEEILRADRSRGGERPHGRAEKPNRGGQRHAADQDRRRHGDDPRLSGGRLPVL